MNNGSKWFSRDSNRRKQDLVGQRRLVFSRYSKIGLKIISQKFCHILAIEKQADSFVEVACHLSDE